MKCSLAELFQQGLNNDELHLSAQLKRHLEILRNPMMHSKEEMKLAYDQLESSIEMSLFVEQAFERSSNAHSPMATFWLSFMHMVEILLLNIHALRMQDWDAFKASIRMMMPWLQIYDNTKYGKWLPEFWLESMSEDKQLFMSDGLFSQSMTGKPYSCLPLDMWIEMTMNKGSKMKAGWSRFLKNEPMLLIHTRTINAINLVRASLHVIANLTSSPQCHSELSTTRLKVDEQAVQDLDSCITEFACDPFDLANPRLRSLQSENACIRKTYTRL